MSTDDFESNDQIQGNVFTRIISIKIDSKKSGNGIIGLKTVDSATDF